MRACTLLFLLAALLNAQEVVSGGHLLLFGGGSEPEAALQRFVDLCDGGAIAVLPLASSRPEESGRAYRELFLDLGATEVHVLGIDRPDESLGDSLPATLRDARGVWFSGGDQRRITRALLGTPALAAIRAILERGGVVGGTSAGTACQSCLMFTGDGDPSRLGIEGARLSEGLGLVEGVILDQHFVARSRQNRLLSAVLQHPRLLGIGVDEGTVAWFGPDRELRVLGDGCVVIYDAREAEVTREGTRLAARGLTQHILIEGQSFHLPRAEEERAP